MVNLKKLLVLRLVVYFAFGFFVSKTGINITDLSFWLFLTLCFMDGFFSKEIDKLLEKKADNEKK